MTPDEAPDVELDGEKAAAFERLLEVGDGRRIDYGLPYPKHEFFAYAVQRGHLLHGSSDGEIDVFEPRWQTDGRGRPVKRTFATHHAVWPMYYAILDRIREYSLRNGPSVRRDADGVRRTYFHFSIDTESLLAAPFVPGTVYVLPAQTYEQTEGYEHEWMSAAPARPVVRVPVTPDDFPFFGEIWGNDWRVGMAYPRLNFFPWVNHARIFPVRPQRSGP